MRALALAALLFVLAISAGAGPSRSAVGVSRATVHNNVNGQVAAISCGAPGDCSAGGYYRIGYSDAQAFVVSETNGSWGTPIEVASPGVQTSTGPGVNAISCSAAGECAAAGLYYDAGGQEQVFVISETNGSWGTAMEVPGLATLNSGGYAWEDSISCGAPGDCALGGYYTDSSNNDNQAFVVSETSGSWGTAIEVPGTAALNNGGAAEVDSVSCATAGKCTAGGSYEHDYRHPRRRSYQAFVVNETNGSWGSAIKLRGTATVNTGESSVDSISCAKAGDCAVGGSYFGRHANEYAFVVDETKGRWGHAIRVPGTAALLPGVAGPLVSCAAVGRCAAAGNDLLHGRERVFVVSETNGSWGKAISVPGSGGYAWVGSISCAAVGDCAAGGSYLGARPFVVSERNGTWGRAVEVPGTATLNIKDAFVLSISCAAPGDCAAGGHLQSSQHRGRAFVAGEKNGKWSTPILFPASCVLPNVVGTTIGATENRLSAADCVLGKITYVYSNVRKARVVAQHPRAGTVLGAAARLEVRVSRGKQTSASRLAPGSSGRSR